MGTHHTAKNEEAGWGLSQEDGKQVFGTFPYIFRFYTIHETLNQYSSLDTTRDHISYFGPPGAGVLDLFLDLFIDIIYKRIKNTYYIRPTCNGFWGLKYKYFPGGPKQNV